MRRGSIQASTSCGSDSGSGFTPALEVESVTTGGVTTGDAADGDKSSLSAQFLTDVQNNLQKVEYER